MTDEISPNVIEVDCFYVGKKVRDKNSPLFQLFRKHVLEEVKAKLVIAAHNRELTFLEQVQLSDGREGCQQLRVTQAIQIADVFAQIPKRK